MLIAKHLFHHCHAAHDVRTHVLVQDEGIRGVLARGSPCCRHSACVVV